MLGGELNLLFELVEVFESLFEFKVDKKAVVVVKSEQVVFLALVGLEHLLEQNGVAREVDVFRAAVRAVRVFGHESFNVDASLVIDDVVCVVFSATVVAGHLALLDVDEDFVRKADVHECVHAATELFEHLCFAYVPREVDQDEAFLGVWRESQHFEWDLFVHDVLNLSVVEHFLDFHEERVREICVGSCLCLHVLQDLGHRNDWNSEIDGQTLRNFLSEDIRRSEDGDLGVRRPSLDEMPVSVEEALLQPISQLLSPHLLLIIIYLYS